MEKGQQWYLASGPPYHDIVIIDETGHQVGSRRVAHSPQGLNDLTSFLESLSGSEKDQVACIIETNQGLLITAELLAGYPVFPVNPKTVDRRRVSSGAKTDLIDAYWASKNRSSGFADLRRLEPDSPKVAELKALCRDQDRLIQSQTRLVNQLTACLKAYYPIALQLKSSLQQSSTLVFLQTYPTPQQAMEASSEQIVRVLKQAGHPTAKHVAPKIVEALHQPQLQADQITTRTNGCALFLPCELTHERAAHHRIW